MSIRNLDSLFAPSSVAVFGASPRPASVGGTVWSNLRSGDFEGPILAVNPKYRSLGDEPVHARASHLPCVPELAVICTPPAMTTSFTPDITACAAKCTDCCEEPHWRSMVTPGTDSL